MEQLVESIQSLGYQFVLIDCPAGIDVGFINAISPAKEALIVTTPEITSIRCVASSRLGSDEIHAGDDERYAVAIATSSWCICTPARSSFYFTLACCRQHLTALHLMVL
jgi:hypothetical protein